jgi:molybdenum-dependent DNA-binding transcriptional regulator ModE
MHAESIVDAAKQFGMNKASAVRYIAEVTDVIV